MKGYYDEDNKILKSLEYIKMGKHFPSSWIESTNIIKIPILPKAIYIFNAIPSKNLGDILYRFRQAIIKWIVKAILNNKNKT